MTRIDIATDRYLELVQQFPLRPIRSDAELDQAIAVVNSLIDRAERSNDEEDYLDVLGTLVKQYETEAHPIPPGSDAEMLRHLISAGAGITESTISEILAGKRGLNRRHIQALAKYFHVRPAVFISD